MLTVTGSAALDARLADTEQATIVSASKQQRQSI
jgi:hypothetical protein